MVDHGAGVEGCRRDPQQKDRGELSGDTAAALWFVEGAHAGR